MKRATGFLGAVLLAGVLAGCSSDSEPSPADCLKVMPGVSTGIYGCVTSTNDAGSDTAPKVLPDFPVQIFKEPPPPTPDDGLLPFASTKSDALGYFELSLEVGSYWICTSFRRCSQIDVVAGRPLQENYDFGEGPGW